MKEALTNRFKLFLFIFAALLMLSACDTEKVNTPQPGWPKVTNETKPWSRWWWMGNSVNPENLTAAMEAYSKAGLGGLEITPIYGVHGYEDRFVKFLSPEWMEDFKYTLAEGKRLDMGIDLAMASGWPFGGLWVQPEDACKYMDFTVYELSSGEQIKEKITKMQTPMLRSISRRNLDFNVVKFPVNQNADSLQNWALEQVRYPQNMPLRTLMAFPDSGEKLDLTKKVSAEGILDWTAPDGKWKLIAVFEGLHGKMVERAGPGGEGDVIDHFSETAIDNYLNHFSEIFNGHDISGLRAYFNDSYEVDDARGEADFTPLLFDEFINRRGYDLRQYLPALLGQDSEDTNQRVLSDFRETISDLILEKYTQRWHDWAAKGGKIIRNQAHGAPANILDLYAAADIPETEGEDIVKVKSASSVAHVTGKKLASSESATWLKDHFQASLGDVKHAIDLFLLAGINHIFYHGTTFSPQDAHWPGWMFYAAVHFGPTNSFWNDFSTLNSYVTRSQSFLQAGKPDNDILLYYPITDEYAVRGRSLLLHFDGAAKGSVVRETAEYLFRSGYAFDYITDRQIKNLNVKSEQLYAGENKYQTLLLPSVKFMPLETFENVIRLAKNGAVVLLENLPEDVPGMGNLEERRAKLSALKNDLKFRQENSVQVAEIGKGQVVTGKLDDLLQYASIRREPMYDRGLQCIRRIDGNSTVYFIANRGEESIREMVPFETTITSAVLYNPMNGEFGKAACQDSKVLLQLEPGESCIVQTFINDQAAPGYQYLESAKEKDTIDSTWTLEFVNGGPMLPKSVTLEKPVLWTSLEGNEYSAFSGTAVYKTSFQKPDSDAAFYQLDLGECYHSARVLLNGKELATLISSPYAVSFKASELQAENTLEIFVSNLMGNRIADMERKGQAYKIFYNTNFPAHDAINRGPDGLFTTKGWAVQASGLAGPVTIQEIKLYTVTGE